MFSISRDRNNILKITNNKIIAIKSSVSLKFSYKNIFILVSIATVLYEIRTTFAIKYEYYKYQHTYPTTALSHLHAIYRFL